MPQAEARKLDYVSFGLATGLSQVIILTIIFAIIFLIALLLAPFHAYYRIGVLGLIGGLSMIVVYLALVFVLGFIGGMIHAAVYNSIVSNWVKIKVEVEEQRGVEEQQAPSTTEPSS
ncbi:hypothetical protein IG193_08575 [Infirmifilum lucidum]|uniref:Uncharacterized protein n=1 Tax=Infirmifilum lucidum TaxID=2776706 RepID=A0A7L9FGF1_9CREN|nr:hypothetical protein [Infirmifilum lucidum]QOJ78787.1 hypothetical protein IG193_08575 [Infirmifilum lucidum]